MRYAPSQQHPSRPERADPATGSRPTMIRTTLLVSLTCLLAACSRSQPDPATDYAHSPYTCVHETDHLPPIAPQADQLYRYGQYLESKLPSRAYDVPLDRFNEIARYYRLAAAYGDYRANLALMDLMYEVADDGYDNTSTPWRKLREQENRRLLDQLVADNIPAGFDREGDFASQDWKLPAALSAYRKAADLGNPHAQYEAAEMLNPETTIGATAHASRADAQVAATLYRCAAEQGYRDAISTVGRTLLGDGRQDDAIRIFQRGVAAGDAGSAAALENFFGERQRSRTGTPDDAERVKRYEAIRVFLIENQHNDVKVPDLERIVPLPPAALPAWHGTFQWAFERDHAQAHAKPPTRPSEPLIARLSKDKHLDPHTGLPLA